MRISDWSSDVCSSDLVAKIGRSSGATLANCTRVPNSQGYRRSLRKCVSKRRINADCAKLIRHFSALVSRETADDVANMIDIAATAPAQRRWRQHPNLLFFMEQTPEDRKSTRLNS